MVTISRLIVLLICLLVSSCGQQYSEKTAPTAINGVLDWVKVKGKTRPVRFYESL
ncbi:MAG: hypothetical protein ACI86H_001639 [bacterium]|jgi:hypothetical protein